jgi:hypothetical protein
MTTDRITVSPLAVIHSMAVQKKVIVFDADPTSHDHLRGTCLAKHMVQVLTSVCIWKSAGVRSIMVDKSNAPLRDDATYLAPIVGQPALALQDASSSPSSTALAIPQTSQALVHNIDVVRLIRKLLALGAVVGTGSSRSSALVDVGFSLETIEAARECGVLSVGPLSSGDLQVALNPGGITWASAILLRDPLPLRECGLDAKHMSRSKLDLIYELLRSGWAHAAALEDWSPESACTFDLNVARPLSYFAALVGRDAIVAKGCSYIGHRFRDGYYRCLLFLPAAKLVPILADLTCERPNEWFQKQLVDSEPLALEAGRVAIEAAPAPPEPLPDMPHDAGILALVVEAASLSRCIVDAGDGSLQLQVYFDNSTHQSGQQRGWVVCCHHLNCIRYRFVGARDRRAFCADMYAWHESGPSFLDKQAHLSEPADPTVIDVVAATIRIEDF